MKLLPVGVALDTIVECGGGSSSCEVSGGSFQQQTVWYEETLSVV